MLWLTHPHMSEREEREERGERERGERGERGEREKERRGRERKIPQAKTCLEDLTVLSTHTISKRGGGKNAKKLPTVSTGGPQLAPPI